MRAQAASRRAVPSLSVLRIRQSPTVVPRDLARERRAASGNLENAARAALLLQPGPGGAGLLAARALCVAALEARRERRQPAALRLPRPQLLRDAQRCARSLRHASGAAFHARADPPDDGSGRPAGRALQHAVVLDCRRLQEGGGRLSMCGIAGLLSIEPTQQAPSLVKAMTDAIAHRGPDGEGIHVDAEGRVVLGHRRLAIVDLAPTGRQPMVSGAGRYVVTYNGEIYNFPELRRELEQRGCAFRGTSDTEVMLAAFDTWGVSAALTRLNGMFAFAVWDRTERRLWLARDRAGEKPLYYWSDGRQLIFASEMK